ncbi:efflux RND transporter permease subunit [Escherichia coli]
MPEGIGIEWTGLSFQERQAGSQAPALYAISLLVVFLVWRPSTRAGAFRSRSRGGAARGAGGHFGWDPARA